MSGHTKAPWIYDHYGVRDRAGYICEIHWPHMYEGQQDRFAKETAEREADERMIAASPDLLDALKGLLADIEEYQTINNLGGHDNHWQVIARAAIDKAEGK